LFVRACPTCQSPLTIMSMSRISPMSSSDIQSIFNAALQAYERKTKNKLLVHPLAAQLQSCDSPTTVLCILQDLIQQLDQRRSRGERARNLLNPTVNVLFAFSSTLGEGVGLVGFKHFSSPGPRSDHHSSAILTRKGDLRGYRYSSLGERPPRLNILGVMRASLHLIGSEGCRCKPRSAHWTFRAH
jgi:hypothetical protein